MPLKILHLDDEIEICNIFSDLFSSHDFHIKSFTQVPQAIEEAKKNPPDLIFLDYRLPGITGEQVALQMNDTIPKCLITGDVFVKIKYPFVATFKKPWRSSAIQAFLDSMLKEKKSKAKL